MSPKPKKEIGAFARDSRLQQFLVKLGWFLEDQRFNPAVLEPILRHLILIDAGTGYHTIEIIIRNHRVVSIKGADTELVDLAIRI